MNSSNPRFSRRQLLWYAAALPAAAAVAAQTAERYKLGCMASMYSTAPMADALARIRKAGYRYIAPSPKHAGEAFFTPEAPAAERQRRLRRMKDLGVTPFLSLGGFAAELLTDKGVAGYLAQLDLCADFEIPVMVGGGPSDMKAPGPIVNASVGIDAFGPMFTPSVPSAFNWQGRRSP